MKIFKHLSLNRFLTVQFNGNKKSINNITGFSTVCLNFLVKQWKIFNSNEFKVPIPIYVT